MAEPKRKPTPVADVQDIIRTQVPDGKVDIDWVERQAARMLLGAELELGNADLVATHVSLAEAWLSLAAQVTG